jgi:hypothetical protein
MTAVQEKQVIYEIHGCILGCDATQISNNNVSQETVTSIFRAEMYFTNLCIYPSQKNATLIIL